LQKISPNIILILNVVLIYIIYSPGLSGGFMLDDLINFVKLNLFHTYDGIESIINYVLANETGFLKRPITSLSYLLNATNWPADPYFIKLTNVIFHFFNGVLLYFACLNILQLIDKVPNNTKLIALIASLMWLLHPFFVSTVLYANQRQAILPVTFILAGIILYCKGRLMENNRNKSLLLIYLSVFLFTPLATLSKENGVLLPLILCILEFIIVSKHKFKVLSKIHISVLFAIPITVIFVALAYKFPDWHAFYNNRYFTLSERLLTQLRALTDYLIHFFYPASFTEGVYTDGYTKSISMLQPISTLFSALFLSTILIVSIIIKKKNPLISFAIAFFFISNIIESTIIPLELYFEHRSYLPTIFIPLSLSSYLTITINQNKILLVITALIIFFLSYQTFKKSTVWGSDYQLAIKTNEQYPESFRASIKAASELMKLNRNEEAVKILKKTTEINDNVGLYSVYLELECRFNKNISQEDIEKLKTRIRKKFLFWDKDYFVRFIRTLIRSDCHKNKYNVALEIIEDIKTSKDYSGYKVKETVYYTLALTYVHKDDFDSAFEVMKEFINYSDNHIQMDKIFDILDYFIGHEKYEITKLCMDMLIPRLENSNFKPDIYNQKGRLKYYIDKVYDLTKNK